MDKRKSRIWLCVALALCLVGSLMAGLIQNSFGYVKVDDISIVTEEGTFTGYLLVPKTATEVTPAPAIVASHGYLNNKEMQDINYVELSRRGFVVFAMDAYSHGHSSVPTGGDPDVLATGGMIQAVEYLWALPFVDSSRIGVTGHSMGGGYADKTAAYYTQLEKDALAAGLPPTEAHKLNKVAAALIIGNVPTGLLPDGLTTDIAAVDASDSGYLCELGAVFARYDEFGMMVVGGPLTDMMSDPLIKSFIYLQSGDASVMALDEIAEGHRYANSRTGYGIRFWAPYETHPWNHFSTKCAAFAVEFFSDALGAPRTIAATNQVWWLKEAFNCVGLAGFFLLIVPLIDLMLDVPFFAGLRAQTVPALPAPADKKQIRRYRATSIIGMLLPAILYIPLVAIGFLFLLSPLWPQDTTGGIALWSLVSGLIALWMVRVGSGKFKGQGEALGLKVGDTKKFGKTVLLALSVVSLAYVTVFAADYFFKTDFRIWTFAIRTFSASKIWVAVKYLPFFLVFYVANSLSVSRRRFDNWSERKQILISMMWNVLGVILVLLAQYIPVLFTDMTLLSIAGNAIGGTFGQLIGTGGALFPLLLYPFIPILAIAAAINVKVYNRTGNIWLAGLVNAFIITMLTVANTSFSFPY